MTLKEMILQQFEIHGNRGHIADTCMTYLDALGTQVTDFKSHVCRVALAADAVAGKLGRDERAAFYGGLLHDYGKILLPQDLFNGEDISREEYEKVKTHAEKGFELLKESHLFSALVAGLHHKMGSGTSYGISCDLIPPELDIETVEEVVGIAVIISATDFADAAMHRKTLFLGPEKGSLRQKMLEKYDGDEELVDAVLEAVDRFKTLVFQAETEEANPGLSGKKE